MTSKSKKIELLHASDPRSEMVEINKVVYEIGICKVVEIACDGNLQKNIYERKKMKKIELLHAPDPMNEIVEINKVAYEI